MRRSMQLGCFALAVMLVAVACGGDSTQPTTANTASAGSSSSSSLSSRAAVASIDACKLSASDISTRIGIDVMDGVRTGPACLYNSSEGLQILVVVTPVFGGAAGADQVVADRAKSVGATSETVAGLGDKAFFLDYVVPGDFVVPVSELYVFVGDTQVVVSLAADQSTTSIVQDRCKALALLLLK